MQGVHDLAENIELELAVGRVSDADRFRVLITRQPIQLPFPEHVLAPEPIHDLHL